MRWLMVSFNSLYEIQNAKDKAHYKSKCPFNSLYEIQIDDIAIFECTSFLSILFMRFSPLKRGLQVRKGMLSILFMRFGRENMQIIAPLKTFNSLYEIPKKAKGC